MASETWTEQRSHLRAWGSGMLAGGNGARDVTKHLTAIFSVQPVVYF